VKYYTNDSSQDSTGNPFRGGLSKQVAAKTGSTAVLLVPISGLGHPSMTRFKKISGFAGLDHVTCSKNLN